MRKSEFNNKLSLRGEHLCSTWQSQQNEIIDRDAHVSSANFLSMTKDKIISRDAHVGTLSFLSMTIFLLSNIARAECVPQPNCASIGYTETSCETQAVKCPFDSSKLYCLPCDSKYQYSCSGVGESGSGSGCKGKYESCTCADNYVSFCDVIFCS